ncbi:oxygenase MpaB family protein [Leifsonia sp. EB34]|uniref:oxygenase MpaB family protein n=1 Tax=Leifsonia sp. EB34 TaxID=3156303 RepID=UPI0035147775
MTTVRGVRGVRGPEGTRELTFRQLTGEALCLAGGGRALLLQIAHPAVGRGVVEHSDFADRMVDRFHATMTFVYAATFATPAEFEVVRRRVNRAHAPVRGAATGTEPAYSAFDHELQLWVAATLYATMTDLADRVLGPQSATAREQLYREATRSGVGLQVRPEEWPPTEADFRDYWDDMVGQLRVTDATRAVAEQILHPRGVPLWLRATLPDARIVTAGLLPPDVRDQFRLPWSPSIERGFERRMRVAAAVYPRLPERLRHQPRDLYLRRLRRSIAEGSG